MNFKLLLQDNIKKINNIDFLDSSKEKDFVTVAKKIGRNKNSCYTRWNRFIVPVLKSDALGVAQNVEWRNDVLRYIVKEKFASSKEVSYHKVVRDCCPGQTAYSVREFLGSVPSSANGMQLYESCNKRLTNPSNKSYEGDEEKFQEKYLPRAREILELKQSLISTQLK